MWSRRYTHTTKDTGCARNLAVRGLGGIAGAEPDLQTGSARVLPSSGFPTDCDEVLYVLTVALSCIVGLFIIWLGYPLVVAALAALFGQGRTFPSGGARRVSVIIASVDPADVIRKRVADVLNGDYPAELLDVVVGVDRRRAQAAEEVGRIDPRVRVVLGDEPGGKAASLNAAVRAATGDILVFSDAAQRFDRSTIRRLVSALDDPRLGAVSGALQIGRDGVPETLAERYWVFEKWLRLQESRLHSTVGVTGAVYAMRRECWQPLPAGVILDDVYTPMSLVLRGYRVGFEPTATAFDDRRFPPAQEFRRKARTLTGVVQLCVWLPAVLLPWRNPIWLQFLFHKLLRLATPYLLLIGALAGGGWLASGAGVVTPVVGSAVLAALVAVAAIAMTALPRVRRAAAMTVAMQAAVMRATINGFRGHWDVWSR